jgi:uncharacterized coiled-coil DUF342 family protein
MENKIPFAPGFNYELEQAKDANRWLANQNEKLHEKCKEMWLMIINLQKENDKLNEKINSLNDEMKANIETILMLNKDIYDNKAIINDHENQIRELKTPKKKKGFFRR